jgi:hypothetical protein
VKYFNHTRMLLVHWNFKKWSDNNFILWMQVRMYVCLYVCKGWARIHLALELRHTRPTVLLKGLTKKALLLLEMLWHIQAKTVLTWDYCAYYLWNICHQFWMLIHLMDQRVFAARKKYYRGWISSTETYWWKQWAALFVKCHTWHVRCLEYGKAINKCLGGGVFQTHKNECVTIFRGAYFSCLVSYHFAKYTNTFIWP